MYKKQYEEGLKLFNKSIDLRPAFPEALCGKGLALMHLN